MELGKVLTGCIPRLRRYARALRSEHAAADDLVQDTLERAWRKSHQWHRDKAACPWLFSIMHNLHVDQARKQRVDTLPLDDAVQEMVVHAGQEGLLEMQDLRNALYMLPIEQREVLLLVAVEQMAYREVAETLGIPLGTVMSRLSRGRDCLRGLLEGNPRTAAPLKVVK